MQVVHSGQVVAITSSQQVVFTAAHDSEAYLDTIVIWFPQGEVYSPVGSLQDTNPTNITSLIVKGNV
jgi:hypothetical protein